MITDIEDYFTQGCGRCDRFATPDCSARRWSQGLKELRLLCREAGLIETVKWGHPCYMHAGRNIVILGAFRHDVRVTFFQAALMQDPERILEKQGPNTRHPDMIRFGASSEVADRKPVLLSYLREAMGYAAQGITPPKEDVSLDLPDELLEALDGDPELAEAFRSLTPGRQRSYLINLTSTKSPATRVARIERFRSRIIAGKGAMER